VGEPEVEGECRANFWASSTCSFASCFAERRRGCSVSVVVVAVDVDVVDSDCRELVVCLSGRRSFECLSFACLQFGLRETRKEQRNVDQQISNCLCVKCRWWRTAPVTRRFCVKLVFGFRSRCFGW